MFLVICFDGFTFNGVITSFRLCGLVSVGKDLHLWVDMRLLAKGGSAIQF